LYDCFFISLYFPFHFTYFQRPLIKALPAPLVKALPASLIEALSATIYQGAFSTHLITYFVLSRRISIDRLPAFTAFFNIFTYFFPPSVSQSVPAFTISHSAGLFNVSCAIAGHNACLQRILGEILRVPSAENIAVDVHTGCRPQRILRWMFISGAVRRECCGGCSYRVPGLRQYCFV